MVRWRWACAAALGLAGIDAVAEPPKYVTVLPFATLSHKAPQSTADRARAMLEAEFARSGAFRPLQDTTAAAADLAPARKAVREAAAERDKGNLAVAREAAARGRTGYLQQPSAVEDGGEIADAWALGSAIEFQLGADTAGHALLTQALAFAPSRDFTIGRTSRLFSRLIEDERKMLRALPQGSAQFTCGKRAVAVFIDGIGVGTTPVGVTAVASGMHFYRALLPGGQALGGTFAVPGEFKTDVCGVPVTDEAKLLTALATNRVTSAEVPLLASIAKSRGAQLVVLGVMSEDTTGLFLDALTWDSSSSSFRRLPRSSFDVQLLNAGIAFFDRVGELLKGQAGTLATLPLSPCETCVGEAPATPTEARLLPATAATPPRRTPLRD